MADEKIPSVDEYIETIRYGLWLVIQTANGAMTYHGNRFAQAMADRQMSTPMPEEAANRALHKMMTEITVLMARSKPQ